MKGQELCPEAENAEAAAITSSLIIHSVTKGEEGFKDSLTRAEWPHFYLNTIIYTTAESLLPPPLSSGQTWVSELARGV